MTCDSNQPLPAIKSFKLTKPEKWMSTEMMRAAFNEFGPMMAFGPDGIKPLLLQSIPDNYLTNLEAICGSSIQSGFTPTALRDSKVIYIPKIGKDTYDTAKSFRPITLTSHLFKGLEKLVYWHVESTTLKTKPTCIQAEQMHRKCTQCYTE